MFPRLVRGWAIYSKVGTDIRRYWDIEMFITLARRTSNFQRKIA